MQVNRHTHIFFCSGKSVCDRYWKVETKQWNKIFGSWESYELFFYNHAGFSSDSICEKFSLSLSLSYFLFNLFFAWLKHIINSQQDGISPGANLLHAVEALVSEVCTLNVLIYDLLFFYPFALIIIFISFFIYHDNLNSVIAVVPPLHPSFSKMAWMGFPSHMLLYHLLLDNDYLQKEL